MALFVKICGLASPGAVSAAIGFEADMLGFTFDPAGPNPLTASQAGSLLALVPSGSDRVGVFADAEDTLIGAVLKQGGLDLIQCNGDEEPGRVRALRTTLSTKPYSAASSAVNQRSRSESSAICSWVCPVCSAMSSAILRLVYIICSA